VEIANQGRPPGAEVSETVHGPGHGIVGMRERVGAFGGSLVARPQPDHGFRVVARIPLEGRA
jgi:signal transduction histidine kinase